MTKPISNERVQWLLDRQKVVEECCRIAQSQMHSLHQGGGTREDLFNALRQFAAERTAIAIELRVLKSMDVQP